MKYLQIVVFVIEILCISCFAQENDYKSSYALPSCVSAYREGFYFRAIECLEKSLPDLTVKQDSLDAFEMLAQSYGMINQIEKSKLYFGLMLDKDPNAEIDTLAFPPNIAIIYNQVKLEKKVSQIESNAVSSPDVLRDRKKNPAIPLLLTSVVLSTGGAVYLYYNGYLARNEYSKLGNDQSALNKKWDEFTYSIAGGIGCSVISGLATILFFKVLNENNRVSFYGIGEGISISYEF